MREHRSRGIDCFDIQMVLTVQIRSARHSFLIEESMEALSRKLSMAPRVILVIAISFEELMQIVSRGIVK